MLGRDQVRSTACFVALPPRQLADLARGRAARRCGRETRTTSSISDEMNSTAMPLARQPQDLVHDFLLGGDVDAARRLVEDQQARLGREPAREHGLLLVAARQQADRRLDARRS